MQTVTESTPFDYLKKWDRARLYARLEEIRPAIDFLLAMHNAGGVKIAGIELAYLEGDIKATPFFTSADKIGRFSLLFDTRPELSSYGFPEVLEEFIHNFCTNLCAEKWAIEFLLAGFPI